MNVIVFIVNFFLQKRKFTWKFVQLIFFPGHLYVCLSVHYIYIIKVNIDSTFETELSKKTTIVCLRSEQKLIVMYKKTCFV